MHTGISHNNTEKSRKFLKWNKEIREWLLEEESFSAMLSIETKWEDPSTTFPRRAWSAIRDFFEALRGNIPLWNQKNERRGLSVLAAHADKLLGAEGSLAELQSQVCYQQGALKGLPTPKSTGFAPPPHQNRITNLHSHGPQTVLLERGTTRLQTGQNRNPSTIRTR